MPEARVFCFDLVIFGPVARHFRFHLGIFAPEAHHFYLDLLTATVRDRLFAETFQISGSSLLFSPLPCDVCAWSSSFSAKTCNFALVPRHFCINLTTIARVARHFRFDLVIFDLSISGPVACHFRFDIAMFAFIAHHFRIWILRQDLVIFAEDLGKPLALEWWMVCYDLGST